MMFSHRVAANRLSRQRDVVELQVQGGAQFLRKRLRRLDVADHDFDVRGAGSSNELHRPRIALGCAIRQADQYTLNGPFKTKNEPRGAVGDTACRALLRLRGEDA